jgi:hypothetical protein
LSLPQLRDAFSMSAATTLTQIGGAPALAATRSALKLPSGGDRGKAADHAADTLAALRALCLARLWPGFLPLLAA